MKKGFTLRVKLLLLFSIAFIIGTVAIGIMSVSIMKKEILEVAHEKLLSDLALGAELIDQKYPGEWTITNGNLYKGQVSLNNNFEAVDLIGELTENTVTIFQGDERIATNVRQEDGSRAVGTKVSDAVAETVLRKGQTYIGEANVVGVINQTAYEPIVNSSGEVIGIWYVGVPNTPYEQMVGEFEQILFLVILAEIIILLTIFTIILTKVTKPITQLEQTIDRIAQGDLDVEELEVKTNDEVGRLVLSVNQLISNLNHTISGVQYNAIQVASSAEQLTASAEQSTAAAEQVARVAQESSEGAEEQLRSVATITESVQQLADSLKEIGKSSENMLLSSDKTVASSTKGFDAVSKVVEQMDLIKGSVSKTTTIMNQLGERSKEIGHITALITSIADQTNLLALNAAIEAARAGENGKGFAVVADEVRKLAEESKKSADEINKMVGNIQTETNDAIQAMQEGNKQVNSGIEFTEEASNRYGEIKKAILDVTDKVKIVTEAVHIMDEVSGKIVQEIGEVQAIAESSVAASQEVAAASQEQLATMEEVSSSSQLLSSLASQVEELVEAFKLKSKA